MTQIHWTSQVSADFGTAIDWTPQTVPGSGDDAILDAPGVSPYTVSTSTSETVLSIQTGSTATLAIGSGTFSATGGTGAGANAGTISIGNNTTFIAGGGLNNSGTISLNSVGNGTLFEIGAAGVSLSGGGHVTLGDNTNNYIYGAVGADTLTNVDNTISGAGHLGNAQLTLVNQAAGVINASAAGNALVLNTSGHTVTNAGLIEATGAGGLTIQNTTVDNSTGGVLFGAGGTVRLTSATLLGGVLKTSGAGVITTTDRGSVLNGLSGHVVTTPGHVDIANNTSLTVVGMITLSQKVGTVTTKGLLTLSSVGNGTELTIGTGNATISTGQITLSDNTQNFIDGVVSGTVAKPKIPTFTNKTTIVGAGTIGTNLKLSNAGTIDATGANALIIATGKAGVANGNVVANSMLLEATNPGALSATGGLRIVSTIINNSAAGIIQASGAHTHVDLQTATITGGTLKTAGGGVIQTLDRGSLLDGATAAVTNQAALHVANNTSLNLHGAITNTATIFLDSVGNGTDLVMATGGATLSGGGHVTLTDNSQNYIVGNAATDTLTNTDNTISGAGQLGNSQLTLVNQASGVINASAASNALVLNTSGHTVTNAGLIESTGAGGLTIQSTSVDDSSGGVIQAAGGNVRLTSADLIGGTLKTSSGGAFTTTDRGSLLDGSSSTVHSQGAVTIANNTSLNVSGTIDNTGTISLSSAGNGTDLVMATGGATLSGGGAVTLSDNTQNYISGTAATDTLTNADNTISGAGQLGNSQLTLVNQAGGVINASAASNALVLNTSGHTATNAGLIESTGAGGLTINSTTVDDSSGGGIQAAGGNVRLTSADLVGGTLKTSSGGVFTTTDRGSLLDGSSSTVHSQGAVTVANNTSLNVSGTIDNTGTISLSSAGNGTDLVMATGGATLSGGGAVTLSDNSQNYIVGTAATDTLTNTDNTISGAGQLGNGQLTLVNQASGVIDATGAANALVLNTSGHAVTNAGLIEATGAAGLTITSTTVDGSTGGVIEAAGGDVRLTTATLAGGTLETTGTSTFTTTDGGSLLDGSASTLHSQGAVTVANNTSLNIKGAIDNTGTIALTSAGNGTNLIVASTGATLSGGGHVTLSANTQNFIYGATATTTLTNTDNTISGAGHLGNGQMVLVNQAAGIINADNNGNTLVIDTGSHAVTNAGLIEETGAAGLTISSGVANAGTLGVTAGTFTVSGVVTGAGAATIGGGTLRMSGTFNQKVTFTGATGVLDLAHSMTYTAGITGFSKTGGTQLDLRDIGFVSAGEATYSGNTTTGTLTVTDGTHTAHITLRGNYTTSSFIAASDGHGGVLIHDPTIGASSADGFDFSGLAAPTAAPPVPTHDVHQMGSYLHFGGALDHASEAPAAHAILHHDAAADLHGLSAAASWMAEAHHALTAGELLL